MTVIVTGAGGFVGRELVGQLLAQGRKVVALDSVGMNFSTEVRAITGDIADREVRASALAEGCEALVHLATVPGGAAEADPVASRRINIDAMYDLLLEAASGGQKPRVVYASSIAVFGDPFPAAVDDDTPMSPKMIYGGHKAMMESAVSMFSNRGAIDGVTVRLSGILARPRGPSGLKSAFISDVFHALRAGERFACPVSSDATIWGQSVRRCAGNLSHALAVDAALLPSTRAVTLPALRFRMGDLVNEIARQCGVENGLVEFTPDAGLEAAFGTQPSLSTLAADRAGFAHDGTLANLVGSALETLSSVES